MQTKNYSLAICMATSLLLTACASHQTSMEDDPWENWNRKVQSFNDSVDDYAMKPVAKAYRQITPSIIDSAISHFFSNLDDISVMANDALQGKFQQSALDSSRFLLNSTIGIAGFMDIASSLDLPKHQEDFGQTLAVWGVPSGPYLVLPFLGSSSPRGVLGLVGDSAMNPLSYIGVPAISTGVFAVDVIDIRSDNLGTEKIATEASVFGRYEFFRDSYINRRKALIYDGHPPEEEGDFVLDLDDNFDEDK